MATQQSSYGDTKRLIL